MFLSTCRLPLISAFLLISAFSWNISAATLSVSDNLVLRELDDKRLSDGFFADAFSNTAAIELSKGSHTLLIKYKDVYEDIDFAEERLVESEFFIVKFTLNEQQHLKLRTPDIKGLSAAEKFAQSPEIMLLDENAIALPLTLEKQSDYKLAKQVEKVVTALPIQSQKVNESNQVSLSNKHTGSVEQVNVNSTAEKQSFNEQVLSKTQSLPMLKYWWQKASDKDKEDFILYVKGL